MIKRINIHNFWISNLLIVIMFTVASIMSAIFLWHGKNVVISPDFYFHWQRIYELRNSIMNGNWIPLVALTEYNQSGSAVMSMYPDMNLFPMVLFSFIGKTFVNTFYIVFIFRNFFALLVSYYSCYGYSKNKKVSVLFALSYTLSTLPVILTMNGYDIGVTSALIFIPLVLFGSLEMLKNKKWLELSIGMSAVILCHLLSTLIISLFLVILFSINIIKFKDISRVISLLKAVLLTTLLTSVFWIPFLYLQLNNSISLPPNSLSLDGTNFTVFLGTVFDFTIYPITISIYSFLGLILSLVNYKKMNKLSRQILWIAIFFILVCSKLFPWEILQHTFIKDILQAPWRLYVVPQVILSYLFSQNLFNLLKNKNHKDIYFILIVALIMVFNLNFQKQTVDVHKNDSYLVHPYRYGGTILVGSNEEFKNVINSNERVIDYYPKQSLSNINDINDHKATYDGKKLSIKLLGNGEFTFKSPSNINNLSLPFLYYSGIDYQVKLDGKTIKGYQNDNSLMTIKHITKGDHDVNIIVHKTKLEIFSYILSFVGIITLVWQIILYLVRKIK